MSLFSDARTLVAVFRRAITGRRARKSWADYDGTRAPLPSDHFTAAIYFADAPVNLYQIQQWYEPMHELAKTQPVAVIARNVVTANILRAECPLPVVLLPYIADVEQWIDRQRIGAVFYLNQNSRNFQMMRFRNPNHVFLSHGESDKDYMASNQLKAYDYTFIAGQAAADRLAQRILAFDVEARTRRIGRPQVDVHQQGPALQDDGREVVLYAPTWEGDRPSMTYSSVRSHGPELLQPLLSSRRHRVIYRPHPRTGISDPAFASAHEKLVSLIERANAADPAAFHLVDTTTAFGWHLDAADACIADISAVAFDWLATGKPLLLTEPASAEAEVDMNGIAGTLPMLSAADASSVVAALVDAESRDRVDARQALMERYFGVTRRGASMASWLKAAEAVIDERSLGVT